jgi:hypothetical protein
MSRSIKEISSTKKIKSENWSSVIQSLKRKMGEQAGWMNCKKDIITIIFNDLYKLQRLKERNIYMIFQGTLQIAINQSTKFCILNL